MVAGPQARHEPIAADPQSLRGEGERPDDFNRHVNEDTGPTRAFRDFALARYEIRAGQCWAFVKIREDGPKLMEQPRPGIFGVWDRIVGPGMPAAEVRLVLISGFVGSVIAAWRFETVRGSGWWAVVAGLVGFDVLAGAVCNATQTTKSWYCSRERSFMQKVAFILPHLGYIALIAWLWRGTRGFDLPYFAVFSVSLLLSSVAVILSPPRLAAPVAFAAFLLDLILINVVVGITPGLEWFAPGLLLKLLVGHLVPPESQCSA